jgi:hypothetical protein
MFEMLDEMRKMKSFRERMDIVLSKIRNAPQNEIEPAFKSLEESTEIGVNLLEIAALAAFVGSPCAIDIAWRALEKCQTPSQYPSAIAVMIFSGIGSELDQLLDSFPPMGFMNKFQLAWILETFGNRPDLAERFSRQASEESVKPEFGELRRECLNKWNSTPRMPQYDSSVLRFHYVGSSFDWHGNSRV